MTVYEGNVTFLIPDGFYTTVDADDIDDAEFRMIEQAKDYDADASQIIVENLRKVDNF